MLSSESAGAVEVAAGSGQTGKYQAEIRATPLVGTTHLYQIDDTSLGFTGSPVSMVAAVTFVGTETFPTCAAMAFANASFNGASEPRETIPEKHSAKKTHTHVLVIFSK